PPRPPLQQSKVAQEPASVAGFLLPAMAHGPSCTRAVDCRRVKTKVRPGAMAAYAIIVALRQPEGAAGAGPAGPAVRPKQERTRVRPCRVERRRKVRRAAHPQTHARHLLRWRHVAQQVCRTPHLRPLVHRYSQSIVHRYLTLTRYGR